jgi:dihydrofolate reductase
MAALICGGITSLDGYIADERGDFSWGTPDAAVHAFVNDLERSIGTYLYGRRMYEVMQFWETADAAGDLPEVEADYAQVWRSTDKVVFSSTLDRVSTGRTRLERRFDPDAIRRLKAESPHDLSIAGPGLAAHAFRAGLVDEVHMFVYPVAVGGGTPLLPRGIRVDLELRDVHRFDSGAVHLRYAVLDSGGAPPSGAPGADA